MRYAGRDKETRAVTNKNTGRRRDHKQRQRETRAVTNRITGREIRRQRQRDTDSDKQKHRQTERSQV